MNERQWEHTFEFKYLEPMLNESGIKWKIARVMQDNCICGQVACEYLHFIAWMCKSAAKGTGCPCVSVWKCDSGTEKEEMSY